ncbi:MAG: hypothetical protein KY475_13750 [Planctomycetes bacterium]|nr:hypothetical protein [Planctomycetota bacterium]
MKTSQVRFGQLQRFLEEMGFSAERDNQGWRFDHAASNTVFLFRGYRPADRVYEHDLLVVRSQLDGRGLMAPDAFHESLIKTPA